MGCPPPEAEEFCFGQERRIDIQSILNTVYLRSLPFLLLPAGGETGIEEMENVKWLKAKGAVAVYDLSGRRISVSSVLPWGLYIENGKKVFFK